MEKDLYEVLGVANTSTMQEIKSSYLQLALQFHPDKCICDDESNQSEMFSRISNAWKVLGDLQSRREYDSYMKEERLTDGLPVNEVVTISDMIFNQETGEFFRDCRCGGRYEALASDLEEDCTIFCDTCSLCIKLDSNKTS